ncbi:Eukaryotic protein of unknown function (DUF829) domain containing protein [Rhypophila sp. PSN 637]
MAPSSKNALSAMEKLSDEVFLLRPPAAATTSTSSTNPNPPNPKLILMTTWSGALDSHIAKYTSKYQTLYPTAHILLIKSTRKLFFSPHLVAEAIKPAIPVLKACFPDSSDHSPESLQQPELLIHTFSMGGMSSLVRILDAYSPSSSEGGGSLLPTHITIFDSSPASFSASRLVTFLNQPIPWLSVRVVFAPIIYTLSYTWAMLVSVGVFPDPLANWGRRLNERVVNKTELRRAYIYSDGDELVSPQSVEAHSYVAEERGFTVVKRENFGKSKHVAHARMDEGRYWGVVEGTWDGTFRARL